MKKGKGSVNLFLVSYFLGSKVMGKNKNKRSNIHYFYEYCMPPKV
jgi:hypothetical protein